MPSKHIPRHFISNGYYHIFNRGNAKKEIFHDQADYEFFLSLFDCYLSKKSIYRSQWIKKTYEQEIDLIAFCLMPNHFHLCVKQSQERSIAEFMRSVSVRYVLYYNKKYDTVGHVFQSRYKARLIRTEVDLLHLTRYIHQNPLNITEDIEKYSYSSMQFYVGEKSLPVWCKPHIVMDIFQGMFGFNTTMDGYRKFVSFNNKSLPG